MSKEKDVKVEQPNPEELIRKLYQEKVSRVSSKIANLLAEEGLTMRVVHQIEIVPRQ